MSMTTTQKALQQWARWPRPLANLNKTQLWKYPLADPSTGAEWEFSKEVLHRHVAYRGKQDEAAQAQAAVQRAERMLGTAELNLTSAKGKADEMKLHGQEAQHAELVRRLEAAVRRGQDNLGQAKAAAAAIQKELDEVVGTDALMSDEEIRSYYVRRYAGEWNQIMKAWADADLFKAQRYGFLSFLHTRGQEQREDAAAYKNAEGIATLVCQLDGPTFQAMRALYQVRIMPAIQARREFLVDNEPDGQVQVASLKPEQRARYWKWWRSYNTATLRFGWIDDSGVAHDERLFNPNKLGPEERSDD